MTSINDTTDHTACTAIIQATARAGADEIAALQFGNDVLVELLQRYASVHRCPHRPLCLVAREALDAGAQVL